MEGNEKGNIPCLPDIVNDVNRWLTLMEFNFPFRMVLVLQEKALDNAV
jgi:hypothetical protein